MCFYGTEIPRALKRHFKVISLIHATQGTRLDNEYSLGPVDLPKEIFYMLRRLRNRSYRFNKVVMIVFESRDMAYTSKITVTSIKCPLLSISLMLMPGGIRNQFITDFGILRASAVSAPVKICTHFIM